MPEGNCKKYIKVVIGIYIVFSMISPVITKVTGSNLKVSNILNLNEYMQASSGNYEDISGSQEKQIKSIYETTLKNDLKEKVEAKGYKVTYISLQIEDNKEYTLKQINISLEKSNKENKNEESNVNVVNEIKIQIGNNEEEMQNKKESAKSISSKEQKELKEYLSNIYQIEKENIIIN